MSDCSDTRFSVRIYLNARIRSLVLAACGGACSFDPPLYPRLGGGFVRHAETRRFFEPLIHSGIECFSFDVHKLLNKIGSDCLQVCGQSLPLFSDKVPRRHPSARDQKGTPVQIRGYSRSCKFQPPPHTLWPLSRSRTGRRAAGTSQKTCLVRTPAAFFGNKGTAGEWIDFFVLRNRRRSRNGSTKASQGAKPQVCTLRKGSVIEQTTIKQKTTLLWAFRK